MVPATGHGMVVGWVRWTLGAQLVQPEALSFVGRFGRTTPEVGA
jgi:hypothetical protein